MKKFEVSKTYTTKDVSFMIKSRTDQMVELVENGKSFWKRIFLLDGEEYCKPFGTHKGSLTLVASQQVEV